jgi:LysR family glycine cleavage system transcriptional activator
LKAALGRLGPSGETRWTPAIHGAVSRQVRLLADWLGTRLFLRTSRNAAPTQAGADLLAEVGPALDRLAAVSQRLRNPASAARMLRVSALPTFAMRWLIPRLPEFQRDHPGLELRIVTASTPAEQFRTDVDAVISGPGRHSGWVGKPFLREARLPVLTRISHSRGNFGALGAGQNSAGSRFDADSQRPNSG